MREREAAMAARRSVDSGGRRRHSSEVRLRLLGASVLELVVRDDGRGLASPGRPGGQGLANMRMRAQAIGGSVALEEAHPGTRLVVRLPLH